MNIEGTACRLRALEIEDIEAMYGWENDTEVWRVSGSVAPFSRNVLRRLIDEQQFDIYATRQMRLVIECATSGEAVGAVDLFEFDPHHRRAGVGIIVAPPYRRQGYALDALLTLERYAKEVLNKLPMEFAVEAQKLLSVSLEGAVG